MHVLSDHIFSVVIAGVILFIIFALKVRGEQTTTDATQYRAAKVGALSLVEALERDFNNIGAQFLPDRHYALHPDNALIAFDTLANPAHFAFWAQTDSMQPPRQVRYEWEPMGKTVELQHGTTPLYVVRRLVDGLPSGQLTNMVTGLEIHLQQCNGAPKENLSGVGADGLPKQIVVRLRAVSPLGPGKAIEETLWEKTFRPASLWKQWKPEDCS